MTLQKCMYDESLVALQIKHGIIDVLLEKLEWITGTSKVLNLRHEIKKEMPPPLPDMTAPIKRRRINCGEIVHVSQFFYLMFYNRLKVQYKIINTIVYGNRIGLLRS